MSSKVKKSPITNRWGEATTSRIKAEHFEIYHSGSDWVYHHHHQVTDLDGKLFASFSHGIRYEDDPSQHMLVSISEDHGETWSEPTAVAGPRSGQFADAVITAEGIRPYEGKLTAYYGIYEYTNAGLVDGHRHLEGKAYSGNETWHSDTRTEVVSSEDSAQSWSEPMRIIPRFLPNLAPAEISGERLIIPGNLCYSYTDDLSGLSGWKTTGIPRLPSGYVDDPEGFHKACRHRGDVTHYCEGSFFQTDDGIIHMMLRTWRPKNLNHPGYLAVTESRDDGQSWSDPEVTDYTDCGNRFHFARLPDGRYYAVSCPQPKGRRTPLVLAMSEDGIVFDRHYILGDDPAVPSRVRPRKSRTPAGRYGYPYSHIVGDTMYVIYSVSKEDIWICRFRLGELD